MTRLFSEVTFFHLIRSGAFSEHLFSIRKDNVQGIQIVQSPLKKLLRLTEVRLICVGSSNDEVDEVNSLYPFLPTDQAYRLIEQILPYYKIEQKMDQLPARALFIRMLRPPLLWILTTVLLIWLKLEWWYISPVLFVLTYLARFFNYQNTRYVISNKFIQFKTGGLWSTLYITSRRKVIEIEVKQSFIQKRFGLATIITVNRSKPVHHEELQDVPVDTSKNFLSWYEQRFDDMLNEYNAFGK